MNNPHRRVAAAAAGAGLLALSLNACALGSAEPSSDRTIFAEMATDPTSFDPAAAHAGDDYTVDGLLYDTLVARDLDGALAPAIASEWEAVSANEFTFTVDGTATCADGTPITAEVVADSLRFFAEDPGGEHVFAPLVFGPGEPTITVDGDTLTVATATPYSDLLHGLSIPQAGIICPAGLADPEGLKAGTVEGAFSGPYVLGESTPGVSYAFELREDYDRWPAYLDSLDGEPAQRLVFTMATDQATTANKLISGDLDVGHIGGEGLDRFEGTEHNSVATVIANVYVMFNERDGRFFSGNPEGRKAVAQAIDRAAFNAVFSAGKNPLFNSVVPDDYLCALDDESLIEEHDPAAAEQELEGARIRLVASTAFGDQGKGAEYLQKVLSDAGAKVELERVDNATWATRTQDPKGDWDLTLMGDINAAKIISASLDRVMGPALEDGGRNIPGNDNAEGAEALAAGRATVDPEQRCQHYLTAQRSMLERDDVVPLTGIMWSTYSAPDVTVQAPGGSLSFRTVRVTSE